MPDDPAPIQPGAAGCAVMTRGGNVGQWTACPGRPLYAAVWIARGPRAGRWRAFLCEAHRGHLAAARALTEADRAALEQRRTRLAAARRGEPWVPPRPLSG